ncbi:MAG TPA: hypothetical protein VHF90_05965 [Thermoleophilaceae bacterium]|nr:hypothetical protein [Thermoleophilaceae bacterium]
MPDAELVAAVIESSKRLIDLSPHGETSGAEVAADLGRSVEDDGLVHAFNEAERRGDLKIFYAGGGELPESVSLPGF